MGALSRRNVLSGGAVAAATALGGTACADGSGSARGSAGDGKAGGATVSARPGSADGSAAPSSAGAVPIGDGSTSDTGPQPHQPVAERLKPGQRPPQFVIFSWDG